MARIAAEDVLELLKRDGSRRAAHVAALRAIPFCTEFETLHDGVVRLDAWLSISSKLNHQPLNELVIVVLACFADQDAKCNVKCIHSLNRMWVEITRDLLSPCATPHDAGYLRNARVVALCVLHNYLPEKYGKELMAANSDGYKYLPSVRGLLDGSQQIELAAQARRKVIHKMVDSAVRNVLRKTKEETKCQRLRSKRQRRKAAAALTKPMQTACVITVEHPSPIPCGDQLEKEPSESVEISATISRAADECIICLDVIGSKRSLFSCGHALWCDVCAIEVHECPMCRQPISILMDIFV